MAQYPTKVGRITMYIFSYLKFKTVLIKLNTVNKISICRKFAN